MKAVALTKILYILEHRVALSQGEGFYEEQVTFSWKLKSDFFKMLLVRWHLLHTSVFDMLLEKNIWSCPNIAKE